MGKPKKIMKKMAEFDWKKSLFFGPSFVRVLIFCSMVLLLLYSLVFHNFIIILVILLQALALLGTLF